MNSQESPPAIGLWSKLLLGIAFATLIGFPLVYMTVLGVQVLSASVARPDWSWPSFLLLYGFVVVIGVKLGRALLEALTVELTEQGIEQRSFTGVKRLAWRDAQRIKTKDLWVYLSGRDSAIRLNLAAFGSPKSVLSYIAGRMPDPDTSVR
jgi:hypothetical protein